jgi:hypothetical protein
MTDKIVVEFRSRQEQIDLGKLSTINEAILVEVIR